MTPAVLPQNNPLIVTCLIRLQLFTPSAKAEEGVLALTKKDEANLWYRTFVVNIVNYEISMNTMTMIVLTLGLTGTQKKVMFMVHFTPYWYQLLIY